MGMAALIVLEPLLILVDLVHAAIFILFFYLIGMVVCFDHHEASYRV